METTLKINSQTLRGVQRVQVRGQVPVCTWVEGIAEFKQASEIQDGTLQDVSHPWIVSLWSVARDTFYFLLPWEF